MYSILHPCTPKCHPCSNYTYCSNLWKEFSAIINVSKRRSFITKWKKKQWEGLLPTTGWSLQQLEINFSFDPGTCCPSTGILHRKCWLWNQGSKPGQTLEDNFNFGISHFGEGSSDYDTQQHINADNMQKFHKFAPKSKLHLGIEYTSTKGMGGGQYTRHGIGIWSTQLWIGFNWC